ncbi:MAG: hypothetical protein ACI9EF_003342 [Pseudohongiellaceae bacterium]|jgi:hypothetical protein
MERCSVLDKNPVLAPGLKVRWVEWFWRRMARVVLAVWRTVAALGGPRRP